MPTTTTTTYMGMVLPNVLSRVGSTYASDINTALGVVDIHDHDEYGVQLGAGAFAIDNNVSWGGYSITALKATTYTQQATVTTANSVWFKSDGNLWATNGSGTAIQITSGGSLFAASLAGIWNSLSVTSSPTIATADTYIDYRVDTSAARTITLPSASAVGAGRFYVFHDVTGGANVFNITIQRAGSDTIDGSTSLTISTAYGWAFLISTGTGWSALIPRFGGDLTGTNGNQTVVAVTGLSNTLPVKCDNVVWSASLPQPILKQAANTTTAGVTMYIEAQSAAGSNQAGGILNLAGGEPTGSGKAGVARLCASVSGYQPTFVATAFSATRRVAAINADPATDVPTGDKVIYIANASTNPSSNPVGGGVLYVNAGALTYRGSSGTVTVLGAA
jgi:hypothetical protein